MVHELQKRKKERNILTQRSLVNVIVMSCIWNSTTNVFFFFFLIILKGRHEMTKIKVDIYGSLFFFSFPNVENQVVHDLIWWNKSILECVNSLDPLDKNNNEKNN